MAGIGDGRGGRAFTRRTYVVARPTEAASTMTGDEICNGVSGSRRNQGPALFTVNFFSSVSSLPCAKLAISFPNARFDFEACALSSARSPSSSRLLFPASTDKFCRRHLFSLSLRLLSSSSSRENRDCCMGNNAAADCE